MSGEVSDALKNLGSLKIRTRAGLFSDFITHTKNRISIHVNSSAVDWRICYEIPAHEIELTVDELFSRIPDLQRDYYNISASRKYSSVNEMSYSKEKGFRAKVRKENFLAFKAFYESTGYSLSEESDWITLTANAETFTKNTPLFIHSYIQKTFGTIPTLYISEPFQGGARFSQLCITYMVSYTLGKIRRSHPRPGIKLKRPI
jgi:hypothetical protein